MYVCKGICECNITDCPECEAFIHEESERTEARLRRKPPPPTREERDAKKETKKRRREVKAAVKEAKDDVKKGRVTKIDHFFTKKK
jgi:hypothetical protein